MAERRMFAKSIIDSDAFLDMPLSSQALYFHLSMRADDEGFVSNPKRIQRMVGASDDDMRVLLAKNFILAFESGVIVIKHWKIHNYIRGDRINATNYQEERAMLEVKDNKAYTMPGKCPSDVSQMSGKCQADVSIGKVSIDKVSLDKDRLGEYEGEGVYFFPTKDGQTFIVTEKMVNDYGVIYPLIDIHQEFRSMLGWLDANPDKRKTYKGMKRFINGWLQRSKPKKRSFSEAAEELERMMQ